MDDQHIEQSDTNSQILKHLGKGEQFYILGAFITEETGIEGGTDEHRKNERERNLERHWQLRKSLLELECNVIMLEAKWE